MELLLLKDSLFFLYCPTFTFQYGATATSALFSINSIASSFTFQYGATATLELSFLHFLKT